MTNTRPLDRRPWTHGARVSNPRYRKVDVVKEVTGVVLLRRELGDVLRLSRQRQGRTLREVSSEALVSLGYLSEVERGQKEASSELLASICEALGVPLSVVLREVSDRIAAAEGLVIPDSVPPELLSAVR